MNYPKGSSINHVGSSGGYPNDLDHLFYYISHIFAKVSTKGREGVQKSRKSVHVGYGWSQKMMWKTERINFLRKIGKKSNQEISKCFKISGYLKTFSILNSKLEV